MSDKLNNAEYLLTKSYPTTKDPKVFVSVIDNLFEFVMMTFEKSSMAQQYVESDVDGGLTLLWRQLSVPQHIINDLNSLKSLRKSIKEHSVSVTETSVIVQGMPQRTLTETKVKELLQSVKSYKQFIENGRVI